MKKWNYYNEFDPKAADWIRELIRSKLVPDGEVDTRSISDVKATDLTGFIQCHFFAGICGWPYALQLAAWPSTRPVWTGSCPCQPFSVAGKGKAQADERHLWPAFHRLIQECCPDVVFGEQVASAIGHGWLDGIRSDLEGAGYALGAAVLGAHSVGAPHIRQRLFWGGHRMADAACGLVLPNGSGRDAGRQASEATGHGRAVESASSARAVGDARCERDESRGIAGIVAGESGAAEGEAREREWDGHAAGDCRSAWDDFYVVPCADGKARRIGSGIQPLAHGVPGRVAQLRGLGNAIVPQVAAEFVRAFEEVRGLL